MKAFAFVFLFIALSTTVNSQPSSRNKQYKFSMKEPSGWIKSYVGEPFFRNDPSYFERIITFQRYNSINRKGLNPTIEVTAQHFGANNTRFMKRFLKPSYWKNYNHANFKIIKGPEQAIINGKVAITCTVMGKFRGHGVIDTATYTRKTSYYVHVDKHIFKIIFTDNEHESYPTLFNMLTNSIKIDQL
jgi:hypothetical protein